MTLMWADLVGLNRLNMESSSPNKAQPILMFVLPFLAWVVYQRVKLNMISW